MNEVLQNLSLVEAGGMMVAVVYLVEKIIGWVKVLRGTEDGDSADLIKKLYEMHNVKDRDQVPVWYVKQSFVDAITKMSEEVKLAKRILVDIQEDIKAQMTLLRRD